MYDQGTHENGRQNSQCSFPESLVGSQREKVPGCRACQDRAGNTPIDGRAESFTACLPQVRKADGNNKKRFDTFPEGYDESLKHRGRSALQMKCNFNFTLLYCGHCAGVKHWFRLQTAPGHEQKNAQTFKRSRSEV